MNIINQNFGYLRQRFLLTVASFLIACAGLVTTGPVVSAEIESSIARGGQLYDKWYLVNGAEEPKKSHSAYPSDKKYASKPKSNWRCKECHGWDYMGKDGAYSSGKHSTGIPGITAYQNSDLSMVINVLKDSTHGFTDKMMDPQDFEDLARFVSKGQVNMDEYIDRATKRVAGDIVQGEKLFNTVCAKCHGKDGKGVEDGEALGEVANVNPWEAYHKIRNGQPDEDMPALRVLDNQVILNILAYMQTLPE